MVDQKIKVWDPLVRLLHWTLVTSCITCYFTQTEFYETHLISGYVVLLTISIRIAWGLVGTRYARFSSFIYTPKEAAQYLVQLIKFKAKRYLGHNPAGGTMVITLLVTLLVLTLSGICLDAAENRAGPLGNTKLFIYLDIVQSIHDYSTNVMIGLVILHITGVFGSGLVHRENLVRAMITGNKGR